MDAKQLPARPNLEQFRKQAKDLLKDCWSTQAIQRIRKFHPRFKEFSESEIAKPKFSLADAQWVIAREFAFEASVLLYAENSFRTVKGVDQIHGVLENIEAEHQSTAVN